MALNSLFCADVPLSNYSLTIDNDVTVRDVLFLLLFTIICDWRSLTSPSTDSATHTVDDISS